jgi:hypothetical protein
MHMKRFSLSAAGHDIQYLPGTDACLPTATAGFDSNGQKPELVKALWAGALDFDFAMSTACAVLRGLVCLVPVPW